MHIQSPTTIKKIDETMGKQVGYQVVEALQANWKEVVVDMKKASVAVSQDGEKINQFVECVQCDDEVIKSAVVSGKYGEALKYATEGSAVADDVEVVTAAIETNADCLQWASARLRNTPSVVVSAVEKNSLAIQYASEECRSNSDIIKAATKKGGDISCLQFLPESVLNNELEMQKVLRRNGMGLQYLPSCLRESFPTVGAAVTQNPLALQYASDSMRDNEWTVKSAVVLDGTTLRFSSRRLQDDTAVVTAACKQNPRAFKYASQRLQKVSKKPKSMSRSKKAKEGECCIC